MSLLDTQLAAVFANPLLTVPVVYGAQTTRGFFDESDDSDATASPSMTGVVRTITVLVRAGSLASLTHDTAITVGGIAYTLRDTLLRDGGKVVELHLVKTT